MIWPEEGTPAAQRFAQHRADMMRKLRLLLARHWCAIPDCTMPMSDLLHTHCEVHA